MLSSEVGVMVRASLHKAVFACMPSSAVWWASSDANVLDACLRHKYMAVETQAYAMSVHDLRTLLDALLVLTCPG